MAGARDEKLIADKYSLDYHRRPLATRVWKSRWNWLALVAALVVSLTIYLWRGNSAFWSGPVSDVHASFAMDCNKCHTESWQPALRLAALDSGRHSVPNAACEACHQAGDHHPRLGETELACAACHQEHRADHPLTALADSQCVRCHGDLAAGSAEPLKFAASIHNFADHPEFTARSDTGGVAFNHAVHLAPAGVLDAQRETVHLACADCHVAQPDGRYMAPINYEQHCQSCHPLSVDQLGIVPHESPELVRGTLRERIAGLQLENTPEQPADGRPLLRVLPKPAELTPAQEKSAAELRAAADHALFGLEAKGGCRYCHQVEIQNGAWQIVSGSPTAAGAAMIPDRWLTHAKFHHEQHRTIACEECHTVAASTKTTDVLLPSIDTCRKCHGTSAATMTVSSDCVTCHDYHAPVHGGGVELEKLISQLQEQQP